MKKTKKKIVNKVNGANKKYALAQLYQNRDLTMAALSINHKKIINFKYD